MRRYYSEDELKPMFDLIDRVNISEGDKARAKADLLLADGIAELLLLTTTGLKRLANLAIVKPVRRGIALVSKPAN
jgi:hypothetical protein